MVVKDQIAATRDSMKKAGMPDDLIKIALDALEKENKRKTTQAAKEAVEAAEKALAGKLEQIAKIVKATGLTDCTVKIVVGPDGAITDSRVGKPTTGKRSSSKNGQNHLDPESFKAISKAVQNKELPVKNEDGSFKLGGKDYSATVLVEAACEMNPDQEPTSSVAKKVFGDTFTAGQYNGATRRWGINGFRAEFQSKLESVEKTDKNSKKK